jgi:hypothetical protein
MSNTEKSEKRKGYFKTRAEVTHALIFGLCYGMRNEHLKVWATQKGFS